ncbi:MAG: FHA domain-containing protein [Myxococcales bacterium]|nr:FHA domain-containing protein [Myxococcales bacterium]MDD9970481.1 FHA domain-containing protein [Myxococcales bacterium]
MALVQNGTTHEWIVLQTEHVFGRNPSRADTYLTGPEVSLMHATIRWRQGEWCIADHSRNGSFADGHPLPKESWVQLGLGQELRFGSPNTCPFLIMDLSPPSASLVPQNPSERPILLTHNTLLPDDGAPELSIYRREDGQWMLDRADELRSLEAEDTLCVAGRRYRLVINAELFDTSSPRAATTLTPVLRFSLSSDEEHARLVVHRGPEAIDLGERIHHYCLVTMARRRIRDAGMSLPPAAQGWLFTDELAKLLGIEVAHLNIQIYRARNQLMSAIPGDEQATNVVERRRGSLRLGDIAFEIVRGTTTEVRYEPAQLPGGAEDRPDLDRQRRESA